MLPKKNQTEELNIPSDEMATFTLVLSVSHRFLKRHYIGELEIPYDT